MIEATRLQWDAFQEASVAFIQQQLAHESDLDPAVLEEHWFPQWTRLDRFLEARFPGFEYQTSSPVPEELASSWCWTTAGWYFLGSTMRVFVAPAWPQDSFDVPGEDQVHLSFRHESLVPVELTVSGGLEQLEVVLSLLMRETEVITEIVATQPLEKSLEANRVFVSYAGGGKTDALIQALGRWTGFNGDR